jgi:hypothetical protein
VPEVRALSFYHDDGLGKQGEMIARAGMARSTVKDVTRRDPALPHRRIGYWPRGSTIVRLVLIAIVVVIAIGWTLATLN